MYQYRNNIYRRTYPYNKNYKPHMYSIELGPLKFYTKDDEEIFFEWINSITCISKIDYIGRKIYIQINPIKINKNGEWIISSNDFNNLSMIFFRYKLRNTKQLDIFTTEDPYIEYNPHERNPFYSVPDNPESKICIMVRGTSFWSQPDEDMFFKWPQKISCITNFACAGISMYFFINSKEISDNDLINLIGYFKRYEMENPQQLSIFMNENNKHIFEKYDILNYSPPKKDFSWYNPS